MEGTCLPLVWGAVLQLTTLFQVVVECWRRGTPEEFWQEFSHVNGTPMTFTGISTCLRQQRLVQDKAIAERARNEYGAAFSHFFTYRRGDRVLVMSDSSSIAKRYRALHGTN